MASTLLLLLSTSFPGPGLDAAGLLAPRPGPIDRSLAIASADFDRDGFDDLAIANFQASTVTILLNDHDGTFTPTAPIDVGTAAVGRLTRGPVDLAVDDFNLDDVDSDGILNTADNCPNLYNPAQEGDAEGLGSLCDRHDVDGSGMVDGLDDIDTDGDGVLDFGPSRATRDNCPRWPNTSQIDDLGPGGAPGGDRVGDACAASPDLVVLTTSLGAGFTDGLALIRLNTGAGGMRSTNSIRAGVGAADLLVEDLTSDGRPDIAFSNAADDTVYVLAGTGAGAFPTRRVLTTGDGPQGVAAGDFDCDGDKDLAVANRGAGTVSLFLNTDGAFPATASSSLTNLSEATVLVAGRIDGDSCDDLAVVGRTGTSRSVTVLTQAGSPGMLTPASTLDLGAGDVPPRALLRNLNGDQDAFSDLIVSDFENDQVLLLAGAGNGTFAAPIALAGPDGPIGLALPDFDPSDVDGPDPDLATLGFNDNLLLLWRNDSALVFTPASTNPISPWKDTTGFLLLTGDASVGVDLGLLQGCPGRLDILSGLGNGFFRALSPLAIRAIPCDPPSTSVATSMIVADVRQDAIPDLVIVDQGGSKLHLLAGTAAGTFQQRGEVVLSAPPDSVSAGTIIPAGLDWDRDGVEDLEDNCPTRYNPALCTASDPLCAVPIVCTTTPVTCNPLAGEVDPQTQQCDSDHNGIGDICQVGSSCTGDDGDGDGVRDYDPTALVFSGGAPDFDRDGRANTVDNCPTIANANQADSQMNGVGDACELATDPDADLVPTFDGLTLGLDNCPNTYNPGQEDNNGDGVGNACILAAALDNCPLVANSSRLDSDHDGIGDACERPTTDLVTVSGTDGEVGFLVGNGFGDLSQPFPPLTGFQSPTAALLGKFSLSCIGSFCVEKAADDVVVAQRGASGPADDAVLRFVGDGAGGFTPAGIVAVEGDPTALRQAVNQRICANPVYSMTSLRFDNDGAGSTLAVVEPGASLIRILLAGNNGLVPPPAQPDGLPIDGPPADAVFVDLNQDGIQDLATVTPGDGDPATPSVQIYLGMGNGLFFTDPSLDPAGVPDGATRIAADHIDLALDSVFPDLALWNATVQAPFILRNTLRERADIDGSGRVDGYDLALLVRAFGAVRGEDFTLQADGTLLQSGTGPGRLVVGSGIKTPGQDRGVLLGSPPIYICDQILDPLTGAYGLPVDLNLDGVVDGADLAILAGLYGRTL